MTIQYLHNGKVVYTLIINNNNNNNNNKILIFKTIILIFIFVLFRFGLLTAEQLDLVTLVRLSMNRQNLIYS